MLSHAFRVSRTDFIWEHIEATCGQYDFTAYDSLLATLSGVGVRPLWILDYGNAKCYPPSKPGGKGCDTAACITGFGRFAAATVTHFAQRNIIFECLNGGAGRAGCGLQLPVDNSRHRYSACMTEWYNRENVVAGKFTHRHTSHPVGPLLLGRLRTKWTGRRQRHHDC